MKKIIKGIFIFFITISALYLKSEAKIEIPGRTDTYANDYAGVINEGTRQFIEETNKKLENKSKNKVEIIVATFPSLEGWDFEDFSVRYGEMWRHSKPGDRDNGIILLVVLDQNRFNIGVGQNLEGIITPKILEYIKQKVLIPNFSAGDYSRGIYITVYTLAEILESATIPEDNYSGYFLVGLVILILALFFVAKKIRKKS